MATTITLAMFKLDHDAVAVGFQVALDTGATIAVDTRVPVAFCAGRTMRAIVRAAWHLALPAAQAERDRLATGDPPTPTLDPSAPMAVGDLVTPLPGDAL